MRLEGNMANAAGAAAMAEAARTETIPGLLAFWAGAQPQRPALVDSLGTVTYGALEEMIGRTASFLRGLGLNRHSRVALASGSAASMARSVLSVACNAVCVPVDPTLSTAALQVLLGRARIQLLLTDHEDTPAAHAARALGVQIRILDQGEPAPASAIPSTRGPRALAGALPRDAVLILSTSEGVGAPRLIPLTHANLLANARAVAQSLRLSPEDVGLHPMPLLQAHGLCNSLLPVVASGGCITCLDWFDVETFDAWVKRQLPSWYSAVPVVHEALLSADAQGRLNLGRWRPRVIRSVSSRLPSQLRQALERRFLAPVVNSYGVAEIGAPLATPLPPGYCPPESAGRLILGEAAVLDPAGNPLPAGSTGDVAVRGPHVFPGYADDVVPDSGAFIQGWFRTGDIGHFTSDGYLLIGDTISRGDAQISPRDVEQWLLTQPGVAQAIVFGVPHPSLGQDVAAAVVPTRGASLDPEALRVAMLEAIPSYKVPSRIALVHALPVDPTGKVRRAGLVEALQQALSAPPRLPVTETEQIAAAFFASALGHETVGMDDNFFALGGDTLRAVSLLLDVETKVGVSVAVSAFLRRPTPAGLATLIEQRSRPGPMPAGVEPYRTRGDMPPLFVAPGLESHAHVALRLLPHLPEGVPVLGLHMPVGAMGGGGDAIAAAAAACVEQIRQVQPNGPYQLAGYSLGGNLAHAIACRLQAMREMVSLLCLIDPNPMLEALPLAQAETGSPFEAPCRHAAGVFAGPALLFRTWERPLRHLALPGLGWEHLCAGGLRVIDLPTTHFGALAPPHAEQVGHALSWYLLAVQGRSPGAGGEPRGVSLLHKPLPALFFEARTLLLCGRPAAALETLLSISAAGLPAWSARLLSHAVTAARERGLVLLPATMAQLEATARRDEEDRGALALAERAAVRPVAALALLQGGAVPVGVGAEVGHLARALWARAAGQLDLAMRELDILWAELWGTPDRCAVAFRELLEAGWGEAANIFHDRALAAAAGPARAMALNIVAQIAAGQRDWATAAELGATAVKANRW